MQKSKSKNIFKKLAGLIKHPFSRKNEPLLHTIEWVFILFAFFAVGLPIIYYQSSGNIFGGGKLSYIGNKQVSTPSAETISEFIGETVEEPVVDVTGWDTYRNKLYGFEIKHPDSWTNMTFKTAMAKNARYQTIYEFRKAVSSDSDSYVGFDVAVYSTKKVASVDLTNDIQKKDSAPDDTSSCQFVEDMTLGEKNNIFQKVSISKDNACFEPTYFFSIKKDNYLYDIIPVVKEGLEKPTNLEQDVNKNFPEYKQIVATFNDVAVSKPPVVSKTVAKPAPSFKSCHLSGGKGVGGRIVCAEKNDHPSYSKTKGHHMDEDCCLDPDESRNPCCTY
jgi:hypothetical protein